MSVQFHPEGESLNELVKVLDRVKESRSSGHQGPRLYVCLSGTGAITAASAAEIKRHPNLSKLSIDKIRTIADEAITKTHFPDKDEQFKLKVKSITDTIEQLSNGRVGKQAQSTYLLIAVAVFSFFLIYPVFAAIAAGKKLQSAKSENAQIKAWPQQMESAMLQRNLSNPFNHLPPAIEKADQLILDIAQKSRRPGIIRQGPEGNYDLIDNPPTRLAGDIPINFTFAKDLLRLHAFTIKFPDSSQETERPLQLPLEKRAQAIGKLWQKASEKIAQSPQTQSSDAPSNPTSMLLENIGATHHQGIFADLTTELMREKQTFVNGAAHSLEVTIEEHQITSKMTVLYGLVKLDNNGAPTKELSGYTTVELTTTLPRSMMETDPSHWRPEQLALIKRETTSRDFLTEEAALKSIETGDDSGQQIGPLGDVLL